MKIISHTLHKSDKAKGESGKYQIIEKSDLYQHGRCCGVYFTKKDAMIDLKIMEKNRAK